MNYQCSIKLQSTAERLNKLSHIQVKEAVNREVIRPGNVYVSPGGKNILIKKVNDDYIIKISTDDEDLNLPNINKLFSSASECFGKNSFGVILTGMGEDGSKGLKDIKDSGGLTLVQDPNDAVIGGMPSAAQKSVPSCFVMNSEKIIPFLFLRNENHIPEVFQIIIPSLHQTFLTLVGGDIFFF